MEKLLLILVTALLAALLTAIGILLWLGHRFLRLQEEQRSKKSQDIPQDTSENQFQGDKSDVEVKPKRAGADILKALRSNQGAGLYCSDHPDMMAVGQCAISGESFCEHCLTNHQDIRLAKKYLDLYLEGDWQEVVMLHNQDISQDAAERIVKVKSGLWRKEGLPIIVQGHYKINVQNDEIEAYTVVIARKDDVDHVRKELSFIN